MTEQEKKREKIYKKIEKLKILDEKLKKGKHPYKRDKLKNLTEGVKEAGIYLLYKNTLLVV